MKIVVRKDFLKLPEGVIYSEIQNDIFFSSIEGLKIKGDAINESIWLYYNLIGSFYDPQIENEEDAIAASYGPLVEHEIYPDEEIDDSREFLVYEKEDVEALIHTLQGYLNHYPIGDGHKPSNNCLW
jgi:hypothetical protein